MVLPGCEPELSVGGRDAHVRAPRCSQRLAAHAPCNVGSALCSWAEAKQQFLREGNSSLALWDRSIHGDIQLDLSGSSGEDKEWVYFNSHLTYFKEIHLIFYPFPCSLRRGDVKLPNTIIWRKLASGLGVCGDSQDLEGARLAGGVLKRQPGSSSGG